MKIFPSTNWKWGYYSNPQDNGITYLVLTVFLDGVPRCFKTRFSQDVLGNPPDQDQSFVVEEAKLLNSYLDGLMQQTSLDENSCFDLAINAVACERFAYLTNPVSEYFVMQNASIPVYRGQVVSLYAKNGGVGDFIVLDNQANDGIYKLMLLNAKWVVSGYEITLGQMIRLPIEYIAPFRLSEQRRTA